MRINVPTSWEDISIRQFIQLNNLKKLEDQDEIEYMMEIIGIMCNLTRKEVLEIPVPDLKYIYSRLSFTLSLPEAKQVKVKYVLDGITYIPVLEPSKMIAGQYIDIKEFSKNGLDNLHYLMACIYIPEGEKYNQTLVTDTAKKFYEKMNVSVAYPLAVFFSTLLNDSIKITHDYLMEETRDQMRKILQDFK
jgi:hypothetical protein